MWLSYIDHSQIPVLSSITIMPIGITLAKLKHHRSPISILRQKWQKQASQSNLQVYFQMLSLCHSKPSPEHRVQDQ